MFEVVRSPWQTRFVSLLQKARTRVYLASPFVKLQTARLISENVDTHIDFKYINCFKLAHFHNGASDLEALRLLSQSNCRMRNVHNLHAKLFIMDETAVVTSGNLTPGGLRNNLEYGVLADGAIARELTHDYLGIFKNADYPEITLDIIRRAEEILACVPKEKQCRLNLAEDSLFESIINDRNADERFQGGVDCVLSNLSGWKRDVFSCLLEIKNDVFGLQEAYCFEGYLMQRHPRNRNVRAKVRQQLQYLRELGLLEFVSPGLYKKLWA